MDEYKRMFSYNISINVVDPFYIASCNSKYTNSLFYASNSLLVSRELCSISNKFKPSKCFYYNGLV